MRVAINGVGVAGPALAYWLRRFGHDPVLFEKAPALRVGGYVIDFWGTGYDLAERMGIIDDIIARGYLIDRLSMMDAAGKTIAALDLTPVREQLQNRFITIARNDLCAALVAACDGIPRYFGHSIEAIAPDHDGVDVTLSDGSLQWFDLVVGADGLHSRVRELAFGPEEQFVRSVGCVVAAFRVNGYPHRDELAYVSHTGPMRQVARVALREDETLILMICRSEMLETGLLPSGQKAALRAAFAGMAWEVPEILARLDDVDDLYLDHVSQIRLDHWSTGRVVLVGDAAACVSLLAGEGTGLAMIEAYVLAGELHRAGADTTRGLLAYEQRLAAFLRRKQRTALGMRGFFAPRHALGLATRNLIVRTMTFPHVDRIWVRHTLADDIDLPRYEA